MTVSSYINLSMSLWERNLKIQCHAVSLFYNHQNIGQAEACIEFQKKNPKSNADMHMYLLQIESASISPSYLAWPQSCLTDNLEAYCQD